MIKYAEKNTIKNIITDEEMLVGEFKFDWQKLIISRQEQIEQKLSLSKKYSEANNDLTKLLKEVGNEILADKIRSATITKECTSTYLHYNYGFIEGLKLKLLFE